MREEMAPGQKRMKAPSQGLKLEFVHGYVYFMAYQPSGDNS